MSALARITQLVAPPSSPRPVAAAVESRDGSLQVPSDYRGLLEAYGPGAFRKHYAELVVMSPGNPYPVYDIQTATRETADLFAEISKDVSFDWLPYQFWPECPGLIQWGSAEIESMYWLTEGEPDEWPTVVMRDTEQILERLEMSATQVLLGLIEGPSPTRLIEELECPGVAFFRSPNRVGDLYED